MLYDDVQVALLKSMLAFEVCLYTFHEKFTFNMSGEIACAWLDCIPAFFRKMKFPPLRPLHQGFKWSFSVSFTPCGGQNNLHSKIAK